MKILEKIWARIIISLFCASFIIELIHMNSGDPNGPRNSIALLIMAAIIFGLFSLLIKRNNKIR